MHAIQQQATDRTIRTHVTPAVRVSVRIDRWKNVPVVRVPHLFHERIGVVLLNELRVENTHNALTVVTFDCTITVVLYTLLCYN